MAPGKLEVGLPETKDHIQMSQAITIKYVSDHAKF
jgi:hypothetical protein